MKLRMNIMALVLLSVLFISVTSTNFATASTESSTVVTPSTIGSGSDFFVNIKAVGTNSFDNFVPTLATDDYAVYDIQSSSKNPVYVIQFDLGGYAMAADGTPIYGTAFFMYNGVVRQVTSGITSGGIAVTVPLGNQNDADMGNYTETTVSILYIAFDEAGMAYYASSSVMLRVYDGVFGPDVLPDMYKLGLDFSATDGFDDNSTYPNDFADWGFQPVDVSATFAPAAAGGIMQIDATVNSIGFVDVVNATTDSVYGNDGVRGMPFVWDDFGIVPADAPYVRFNAEDLATNDVGVVYISPRGLYTDDVGYYGAIGTGYHSAAGYGSDDTFFAFDAATVGAPGKLSGALDNNVLTLTWVGGGDSYMVYRGTTESGVKAYMNTTDAMIVDDLNDLTETTTYYYKVKSVVDGTASDFSAYFKVAITIEKSSPFNAFAALLALFVAVPVVRKFRR